MFRFPLRTQEMASDSEISNTPVTVEALEKMMEALKSELFEVLLFVNSVRKITLCDIDESGKVVNSYFVEAQIVRGRFGEKATVRNLCQADWEFKKTKWCFPTH